MHTHRRYLLPDSALKRLTQRRDKRMNSFPRRYLRKPLFSERLIHCRIGIGDVKIKRQPDKTEFPDAREHFEEKQRILGEVRIAVKTRVPDRVSPEHNAAAVERAVSDTFRTVGKPENTGRDMLAGFTDLGERDRLVFRLSADYA